MPTDVALAAWLGKLRNAPLHCRDCVYATTGVEASLQSKFNTARCGKCNGELVVSMDMPFADLLALCDLADAGARLADLVADCSFAADDIEDEATRDFAAWKAAVARAPGKG